MIKIMQREIIPLLLIMSDELIKMAKNVDVDKVQEGITSLQKTLALFGDLFASKKPTSTYNPRPLYKRFDD